jgi:hypothetical protein
MCFIRDNFPRPVLLGETIVQGAGPVTGWRAAD